MRTSVNVRSLIMTTAKKGAIKKEGKESPIFSSKESYREYTKIVNSKKVKVSKKDAKKFRESMKKSIQEMIDSW